MIYDLKHQFVESLDDDFNVARGLAALFGFIREVNRIMDRGEMSPHDKGKVQGILGEIDSVLGFMDLEPPERNEKAEALLRSRDEARRARDWSTADRIRLELREMGIEVIDTKEGTLWRREGMCL